jgi:hypothetical protein
MGFEKDQLIALAVIAVVVVIGVMLIGNNASSITGMAASGQGKTKGNTCMAQCTGVNSQYYDASKPLTQACKQECGIVQYDEPGACLTSKDGCCVPYTLDPDCTPAECPCFDTQQMWYWQSQSGPVNYLTEHSNGGALCNGEFNIGGDFES